MGDSVVFLVTSLHLAGPIFLKKKSNRGFSQNVDLKNTVSRETTNWADYCANAKLCPLQHRKSPEPGKYCVLVMFGECCDNFRPKKNFQIFSSKKILRSKWKFMKIVIGVSMWNEEVVLSFAQGDSGQHVTVYTHRTMHQDMLLMICTDSAAILCCSECVITSRPSENDPPP